MRVCATKEKTHVTHKQKKIFFNFFYLSAIFSHFFQAQIVDNIPAQIEREKRVFKIFHKRFEDGKLKRDLKFCVGTLRRLEWNRHWSPAA